MRRPASRWFHVVRLLLATSRRRAGSRMRAAAARRSAGTSGLVYGFALFGSLVFQCALAYAVFSTAQIADDVALERAGKIVVSSMLYASMTRHDRDERDYTAALRDATPMSATELHHALRDSRRKADASATAMTAMVISEAFRLAHTRGGTEATWRQRIEQTYALNGSGAFAAAPSDVVGMGPAASHLLALLLVVWWLGLVLQGEGVALDVTRRRHPMWEWYLAFPVPQTAVFVAEALAPLVGNPFMFLSPVFVGVLSGVASRSVIAGVGGLVVAIPLTLSAAVWAKTLEVLIMLRSSVRNRGGWFALCSGIGFMATFLPLMALSAPALGHAFASVAEPFASFLPGAMALLDVESFGAWLRAASIALLAAIALALPASILLRFATARGLESSFGGAREVARRSTFRHGGRGFAAWFDDPLLHKEWLWLKRDRTALIQLIGAPLCLVSLQFFNLRNMLSSAELTWNKLAGVIVGMGGYLLFVSGPRALMSEGPALALTMSWPRSLEDSLRIKVRLLFVLVSAMVWLCLAVVAWMFPGDAWRLLLVAIAWIAFGLSVAEKAVTLIRQPSQSGEPEPLSQSRLWVASLGNLTFAIAIFTARWQLAIAAIAMNWVFAGALWQGFRVRLAYLFDPESQPAPIPPTILSSLVAAVGLLEIGAIISTPIAAFLGPDGVAYAMTMGYGAAALIVGPVALVWHANRGVGIGDLVRMDDTTSVAPALACIAAAVGGVALGGLAVGYRALLWQLPWPELHAALEQGARLYSEFPHLRTGYAVMAVAIAPWIEEFIFRGLMFRAMLPQWGLWRAAVASAAFFTVLHPALAWPPVLALGLLNALIFARSRALLPCIVLHACYNAVVVVVGMG